MGAAGRTPGDPESLLEFVLARRSLDVSYQGMLRLPKRRMACSFRPHTCLLSGTMGARKATWGTISDSHRFWDDGTPFCELFGVQKLAILFCFGSRSKLSVSVFGSLGPLTKYRIYCKYKLVTKVGSVMISGSMLFGFGGLGCSVSDVLLPWEKAWKQIKFQSNI